MAYTNRNFTWDFDALKRFYEKYIVKWINSAVTWTEAQKKQARANLGFGNGDAIVTTADIVGSDLDVVDDSGNILMQLKNGHIKTKEFDSSKNSLSEADVAKVANIEAGAEVNDVITDDTIDADLEFSDEQGNTLVRFQEGHIKTKEFDSSQLHSKYADRPASGYENFLVQVNTEIENNDSVTNNLQDSVNIQQDRCLIALPVNYSADGNPVRLIIAGQSSSGVITSSTTSIQKTVPHPALLLAEGYAVLQVNGTPGETDGIETYGGAGTPAYLKSVTAAYNYVINKYNIKKDGVLLCGWSQGTLKIWQIAANKVVPVKAMVMFGFAPDLWKLVYAYCPASHREWICEQFGFVDKEANAYVLDIFSNIYSQGDTVTKPATYSNAKKVPTDYEFAYILNNYEKWLGYDPICWGTSKNIIAEQFRYRNWVTVQDHNEDDCFVDVANIIPCPVKLFVALDDTTTTPKLTEWYKTMADNGGMLCHVRHYLSGGHNYASTSDYPSIQVQTKYGGTITTNVPSQEGVLFLERYD